MSWEGRCGCIISLISIKLIQYRKQIKGRWLNYMNLYINHTGLPYCLGSFICTTDSSSALYCGMYVCHNRIASKQVVIELSY